MRQEILKKQLGIIYAMTTISKIVFQMDEYKKNETNNTTVISTCYKR